MSAVPFYTFDAYLTEVMKGKNSVLDMTADDFEIYLTDATPNRATHSTKADLADITNKNGYSGAVTLTISSRGINSNAYRIVCADYTWTGTDATDATGFGPFRRVVLLNKSSNATAANRKLVGYWEYPSTVTVLKDDVFKVDFSATTGGIRLIGPA